MKKSTGFYSRKVDLRSRKAMIDFLASHPRYSSGSHWSEKSYAHCVKIHYLGLNDAQRERAFEMLDCDGALEFVTRRIATFTDQQIYNYTVGLNGRSNGYLVLYRAERVQHPYRTRCVSCGQGNFNAVLDTSGMSETEAAIARYRVRNGGSVEVCLNDAQVQESPGSVAEKLVLIELWGRHRCQWLSVDNRCGVCDAKGEIGRQSYSRSYAQATFGVDQEEHATGYDEVPTHSLRDRVKLVQAFDALCDQIRNDLIRQVSKFEVIEEPVTRVIHGTVKRLRQVPASAGC